MNIYSELQNELTYEYEVTKKFLSLFPDDNTDYKPHEKSMALGALANHVVEIFAWPLVIMDTLYLDFGTSDYTPSTLSKRTELLKKLDEDYQKGKEGIKKLSDSNIDDSWDIRQGDMVFAKWTKYGAIRHSLNQITHHRAQLGVYYRLNNIKIPGSYGPSADNQTF